MTELILIIGGGGFIGRHLVSQLVSSGANLRVLDIIEKPEDFSERVEWHKGSILDEAALNRAMGGAGTVFHLAALAHLGVPQIERYEEINVTGTANVLSAVKRHNIKHLLITSTEVILRDWRKSCAAPLTAANALPDMDAMAGPYCRSKLTAEKMARAAIAEGQPISLLYPTVPIGPGDYNLTAPTAMLRQFLKSPPPAFLDCRLNLVPVEDVAKGHILAAAQPPGGKYMLGGDDVEMTQLLEWLAPLTTKRQPKRSIPYGVAAATAHVSTAFSKVTGTAPLASVEGVRLARRKVDVDSGPTEKALGWNRGPAKEAVMRAAKWLEEAGLLDP